VHEADTYAPDIAIQLINDFGGEETWSIPGQRVKQPVEGRFGELQVTQQRVMVTPPVVYTKDLFDGDTKIVNASYCFIRGDVAFTPFIGLEVTIRSERWVVKKVHKLVSGLRVAAYKLYVTH
jgi:hypothetical protein